MYLTVIGYTRGHTFFYLSDLTIWIKVYINLGSVPSTFRDQKFMDFLITYGLILTVKFHMNWENAINYDQLSKFSKFYGTNNW